MTITTLHSRVLVDNEPDAQSAIHVAEEEQDGKPLISVKQGDDLIWMSRAHARALGQALTYFAGPQE
jgi:hypothetical protein